jgi:hypothetical protein
MEFEMRKNLLVFVVIMMLFGTLLSACSQAEDQSGDADALPPVAIVRAREVLADDLKVGIESVTIESYERAEWSDSCLGLGGPAESCLAVMTPGWRVTLLVDGSDSYEVRTDELGDIVRVAK